MNHKESLTSKIGELEQQMEADRIFYDQKLNDVH